MNMQVSKCVGKESHGSHGTFIKESWSKESHGSHGTFMKESRSSVIASKQGAVRD